MVNEGEAVSAVPREKFETNESVSPEFFLPPRAGRLKPRLVQGTRRQHELADDRSWRSHGSGGIIKGVHLLLVQDLSDEREIERPIVNAPTERNLGAVVTERQHVGRHARLGHRALRKAVPIRAQAHLENEIPAH